jgi:hypothetical protein
VKKAAFSLLVAAVPLTAPGPTAAHPPRGAKQHGRGWVIPVAAAVLGTLAIGLALGWVVRRGPACGRPSP